jgi:hypothetical protein
MMGSPWHDLRDEFLMEHPHCLCGRDAKLIVRVDDDLGWFDEDNVKAVCPACFEERNWLKN